MRNGIYSILAMLIPVWLAAQTGLQLTHTELGKGIPGDLQEQADRQLISLLTSGDHTVQSGFSIFQVAPSIDVVETVKTEGVQTLQVAKLELLLKLENAVSGDILDSRQLTFTGSGKSEIEAIRKGIQNLGRSRAGIDRILDSFRQSVLDHYNNHCGEIIAAAGSQAARKDYQQAFTLLLSIPQGTPCFDNAQSQRDEYFQKLQENQCENRLHQARIAQSARQYENALAVLGQIDAQAPCFAEAKTLVSEIEPQLEAEQKKRFDWMFQFYSKGVEAEAARWQAMYATGMDVLRKLSPNQIVIE